MKLIIARCVPCRRFEGRPFTAPLPPLLPRFCVQECRPFSHTAIDFAGPLHVGVTRSKKMWICLYTCCVTCAVHIDVVPDMPTAVVEIEAIINAHTLSPMSRQRT